MMDQEGLGFRGVLAIDFVDNFKKVFFHKGGKSLKMPFITLKRLSDKRPLILDSVIGMAL